MISQLVGVMRVTRMIEQIKDLRLHMRIPKYLSCPIICSFRSPPWVLPTLLMTGLGKEGICIHIAGGIGHQPWLWDRGWTNQILQIKIHNLG